MTPDQIFKAEAKLRELKKIEASLEAFDKYVFAADAESVPGTSVPPFPMGKSDLSRLLRDSADQWLRSRKVNLEAEAVQIGVHFSLSEAEVDELGRIIGKVTP